jgi:hypothetical protein
MNQTLTNTEKMLLAAVNLSGGSLERNFTAEELSVVAWRRDKTTFGLRGYENEYPDSNKLFKSIDSQLGLVVKGFITKVGDRTFQLTAGGLAAASQLGDPDTEQQLKLERELGSAVNKLVSHPSFVEWMKDSSKPTKFSGAGHFWGVAPGTPPRVVRDRIARIETTLKEALSYMNRRGVTSLFKEKDRVLCERQDIERCLAFHEAVKQRFAKELRMLLS